MTPISRFTGRSKSAGGGDALQAPAPEAAVSFLRQTMPFAELDEATIIELASHCRIGFFPKGTRLLTFNETEITDLYLIQRGGIKGFIEDEQGTITLKDYRGIGANVGALGIIRGTKANLNIETIEDTFCYLIARDLFLDLVQSNPTIAHYYLKSFSDKLVTTAYNELRTHKLARRDSESLYLFNTRAGDLSKPLFTVSAFTSIQEAAAVMSAQNIDSLLIYADEEPGAMIGIITDTDFRGKVAARGRDHREPVLSIMSSPLRTVPAATLCFDVLLKMMTTGIHHLGVEQEGRITGIITSHDIMVQQGTSPYYLFKEISSQRDFDGLYLLAEKVSGIVRTIINEGGKPSNISRMISLINEQILARVLTLLTERLGPPPVEFCWLLLGSEGRAEQTFKTDQDNGIVYGDPAGADEENRARDYFHNFGELAVNHLVLCGYPKCPDGLMASNPRWCQPLAKWKEDFLHWIETVDAADEFNPGVFFDFRHGFGDVQLSLDLRSFITESTRARGALAFQLARRCMANRSPLSFFGDQVVEEDGGRSAEFDIKQRGILPFVGFARALALHYGIGQTNTLQRISQLVKRGAFGREQGGAISEAFELLTQLRVLHQLALSEQGRPPDDILIPAQLSELEKRMLKDGFAVMGTMREILALRFSEA